MSFDDFGIWCVYPKAGDPIYDIVAISRYCKQSNTSPENLSDEELEQFLIGYEK